MRVVKTEKSCSYSLPFSLVQQKLVQQTEKLLHLFVGRWIPRELRFDRFNVLEDGVDPVRLARELHEVQIDVKSHRRGVVQRLVHRPQTEKCSNKLHFFSQVGSRHVYKLLFPE